MPPFLDKARQGHELCRLWKAQLLMEEALGKSLMPIHPRVAQMEGRPYYRIDFSQIEDWQGFLLREELKITTPILEKEAPFLSHLIQVEKRRKRYGASEEREFLIGFPAILFRDKQGKQRLTCLFKFSLERLDFPDLGETNPQDLALMLGKTPKNLKLTQEEFAPKKGEFPYWFDELFLAEQLGVEDEKIEAFRKAFGKEKLSPLEMITLAAELLFNAPLKLADPFEGILQAVQTHLQNVQGQGLPQANPWPHALLFELEANQPTRQLQNDLDEIMTEELLDEIESDHPAAAFLLGEAKRTEELHPLPAQSTEQPLTASQEAALGRIMLDPFSAVEGPPGTGKTHLIRNLLAMRFTAFVNQLQGPEDRAFHLGHLTLVASTNNRAVDNALEGLDLTGHPAVTLRLGSRLVMQKGTLPFLRSFLADLTALEPDQGREAFKRLKPQLKLAWDAASQDAADRFACYRLAREVHHYWLAANKNRLMEVIGEFSEEIEEKRGFRSLKKRKNLELLLTAFPLVGSTLLSMRNLFEMDAESLGMVIIDEAGQCNPAYVLPALLRARQGVMLGDARQLEPIARLRAVEIEALRERRKIKLTTEQARFFTSNLEETQSAQAIAEQVAPGVLKLQEHFRCHPSIIGVSKELCGYELNLLGDWSAESGLFYQDLMGEEVRYGGSWVNEGELNGLLYWVKTLLDQGWNPGEMAILTPYRGQLQHLNYALNQMGLNPQSGEAGDEGSGRITTGTVHRFQGGERSLVFFSPVIAQGNPDFLNSRVNLLNVAVSRAKQRFCMIGSMEALKRGAHTAILARHLIEQGRPMEELRR